MNFDTQFERMNLFSRQNSSNELGESSQYNNNNLEVQKNESKYTCSYCKGVGHNARSCEHKKH